MEIERIGDIAAFAMVVDINGFTAIVERSDDGVIAQFVRDVLAGGIEAVERHGGEIVGFMGDAFLGILPDTMSTLNACWGIAKDLDRQCSYISDAQKRCPGALACAPGGPSLKIAVEYGTMDISTIESRMLGEHRLLIGSPINYASRIGAAGEGNRCHFGPKAAKRVMDAKYDLAGPFKVKGKHSEGEYEYYVLDMSDICREGPRVEGEDTYWD